MTWFPVPQAHSTILGRSGPNYGEDTQRVLSSVLGMTAGQVAELRAAGVV